MPQPPDHAHAAAAPGQPRGALSPAADDVEFRLRSVLFGSGAVAAWEWQVERRRIVGDPGFAALYGISVAEAAEGVSPGRFFAIIHPQDRDRIRLAMGGMLRGAEILSKEYRILAQDGTLRWLHARGHSQHDGADRVASFSGVLLDITEQKRLEQRLRIAQIAGGVGTFEHVDGFGTVFVTPQFCDLLGLHPATHLPVRTVNAVVHPGDPPIIDTATARTPGAGSKVEFRIVRPDNGELRWLSRRGEYLLDTETSGIRFCGVIYDVTDGKRTEAALRSLNETLESRVAERTRERDRIWRVSQDLLGVADMAGRWLSVNPAWQALLGWSESELVGRTADWLQHPQDATKLREALARLAEGERPPGFTSRLRRRDGSYRWLSWTAVPEAGLLYCVARDVTVEREAAAALVQAEEQLRQAQKMEAVGQLTGGLAHDFNNLLTGITGSLELLQTRLAQGRTEGLDRYIDAAQSACRRAAALTHRLLAFSRRQTLSPRPVAIDRLVADMEELIRRTMGPEVAISVAMEAGLWRTLVDPNQLENALLNLCINARDAMPRGGRLTIAAANQWLEPRAAQDRDLPPGPYVCLAISDTGTGMTPEVIARAFDPFFTTKPLGQGTGLGLSMIHGFVRQSGGQAWIESEPGRGTTVSLYLRRHSGEARDDDAPAVSAQTQHATAAQTVLVVDDEPILRPLVCEVLQDVGYHAIAAADGAAGLQILQSDARIDLLLTDVGLPGGMNGRQLADAGRSLRPDLKVLFITGYAEAALLGPDELATSMQVLTKPFAMQTLAQRVAALLAEA